MTFEKNVIEDRVYASFFIRIVATFIDTLIMLFPLTIIDFLFGEESIVTIILSILLWGMYTSYMISSNFRGTIGKKLLGLEVVDLHLEQLTFKKALVRYLWSLISYTLILPLFVIFFTKKKQTFHDYYANTVVIDKYKMSNSNIDHKIRTTRKFAVAGIITLFIVLLIPLFPYIYFFISYSQNLNNQRENIYRIVHKLPDQNDTVLTIYNKKLVDINKEFLKEKSEYAFFKLKIQEEFLLNCVRKRYEVLGNEVYLRDARYFVENVRNLQIQNNEQLINTVKKYKKAYLDRYLGLEPNLINGSIEQVQVNTKNHMCDVNTSINKIYDSFLIKYLTRQHMSKKQIELDPWLKQIIKYEPEVWKVYLNNEKVKSY